MSRRHVHLLLLALAACRGGDVPLQPTPAWQGLSGDLLLRAAGGGGLLLREESGPVYQVDGSGILSAAPPGAWEGGGPAIAPCREQRPPTDFAFDPTTGEVRVGRPPGAAPLALAGSVGVRALRSPSGRLVALLSSAGKRTSLMPFVGQGHHPPFHHQVVSPTGSPHGPAVRLPFDGRTGDLEACWSPDERWLVYLDLSRSGLAAVPVPP